MRAACIQALLVPSSPLLLHSVLVCRRKSPNVSEGPAVKESPHSPLKSTGRTRAQSPEAMVEMLPSIDCRSRLREAICNGDACRVSETDSATNRESVSIFLRDRPGLDTAVRAG